MSKTARRAAWISIAAMPVVVIGTLVLLARDPSVRNVEWPTQMGITPAAKSEAASAVLPGRMELQPPVPGTVARNAYPLHYGTDSLERVRAGRELVDPLATSVANLARGRVIFENTCAVCHGSGGKGDGAIIPKYPNPPSFHTPASKALPEGQLFHIITFGRNNMPPHGPLVLPLDRWRVIQYIRHLQQTGGKP